MDRVFIILNNSGDVWMAQLTLDSVSDIINEFQFLRARAQLSVERHAGNMVVQKQSSFVDSNEMWQHIRDLQISKVELTVKVSYFIMY